MCLKRYYIRVKVHDHTSVLLKNFIRLVCVVNLVDERRRQGFHKCYDLFTVILFTVLTLLQGNTGNRSSNSRPTLSSHFGSKYFLLECMSVIIYNWREGLLCYQDLSKSTDSVTYGSFFLIRFR